VGTAGNSVLVIATKPAVVTVVIIAHDTTVSVYDRALKAVSLKTNNVARNIITTKYGPHKRSAARQNR